MISNYSSYKKIYQILGLTLVLLLSSLVGKSDQNDNKTITVVFRFDDYSARSNTDLEVKIIEAFHEKAMSFTIGVIPYVSQDSFFTTELQNEIPLDSIKGKILRDAALAGTVEIGIHGYSHQTIVEGGKSEFMGLDSEEQKFRMEKGKGLIEKLTGIEINTFIPPWNRYDLNTLKVAEITGFKYFSASTIGEMDLNSNLKFVPNTCSLDQLKYAVENARNSKDNNPYIIVLFHSYDFIESNDKRGEFTLSSFFDLLNWTAEQKDIQSMTISEIASKTNDFTPERFDVNLKIVNINILLPPFIRPADKGVYVNENDLNNIRFRLILFYFTLIILSFILAVLMNRSILHRLGVIYTLIKYGLTVLLIIAIGYTLKTELAGFKVLIIDAVLLGTTIGIWINDYFKRKKKI